MTDLFFCFLKAMTDLVSTRLQAPADGNVPSHKLLLEKRHVPDKCVKKRCSPMKKKKEKKYLLLFIFFG